MRLDLHHYRAAETVVSPRCWHICQAGAVNRDRPFLQDNRTRGIEVLPERTETGRNFHTREVHGMELFLRISERTLAQKVHGTDAVKRRALARSVPKLDGPALLIAGCVFYGEQQALSALVDQRA